MNTTLEIYSAPKLESVESLNRPRTGKDVESVTKRDIKNKIPFSFNREYFHVDNLASPSSIFLPVIWKFEVHLAIGELESTYILCLFHTVTFVSIRIICRYRCDKDQRIPPQTLWFSRSKVV